MQETDILSVSCLIFVKNLTRWLEFLTLVKLWGFGTSFVNEGGVSRALARQGLETFNNRLINK